MNQQAEYEIKAKQLIGEMTLDEKIGMIHGAEIFKTAAVPRLGIPAMAFSDGPCGVRQDFDPAHWQAIGTSRDEVSYLPCNSAIAATWNTGLAKASGEVLGEEARGRGKDMILGPGVNIKRSPLCGRNFEYFSEDPYLTKELAVPFIKGVQNWDVSACIKHFAANNQETDRLNVDTFVDDETLEEIYYPAFEAAVKRAGVHSVMGAYNKIKGEHCCQSVTQLNKVLRKKWGFDGVVVSDWGGVHDTDIAAEAGIDVEMNVTDNFDDYYMAEPLKEKIKAKEISEELIDEKVLHILVLMQRLHMLDGKRKAGAYNTREHHDAILKVGEESIVLLKNEGKDDKVLPLNVKQGEKILLIGENADKKHAAGGGSAEIKAFYELTPLQGLQMLLGGNATVDYVQGYTSGASEAQDASWQATSLTDQENSEESRKEEQKKQLEKERKELYEQAISAARNGNYDHVIFIGGLNHDEDQEGYDRKDMSLPYGQPELINELHSLCPDMPVVMIGGNPVEMDSWIDNTKALVWMFYNGMEGGKALAEVLLGHINPSGKLPVSFYKKLEDCSAHCVGEFGTEGEVHYTEKDEVGYRYLTAHNIKPLFPFGYGLSYTEFKIDGIKRLLSVDHKTQVVVTIENTGKADGKEVIEVYKDHKNGKYRKLCGFGKVNVAAGYFADVVIDVEADDDETLYIGTSVDDIKAKI
ncbi:MAG: glycoside hydrolase family 3 C-terminal domain-containing protein [Lachnospiraceae bacterium]|nr:glycoside hydrolase family 3 C-terminal domain-containing protein [Lachnospiraceae bacterium]